jgi:hypothetical protein
MLWKSANAINPRTKAPYTQNAGVTPGEIETPACVASVGLMPNVDGDGTLVKPTSAATTWAASGTSAPARRKRPRRRGCQTVASTGTSAMSAIVTMLAAMTAPALAKAFPAVTTAV